MDGLSDALPGLQAMLFRHFGNRVHYFGGGAGSLSLVKQPCVFTCDGVFQDAAVLALLENDLQLGVGHGWEYLEGPLLVTRAEGSEILELNWEPAFEVYKRIVEADAGTALSPMNFLTVAKAYPLGMHVPHQEDVVRDPIWVTKNNGLWCVGEVPQNSLVNVLQGRPERLIAAVSYSLTEAVSKVNGEGLATALMMNCASRSIFLEHDFQQELTHLQAGLAARFKDMRFKGALCIGEIANKNQGYLMLFNKTVILGLLLEKPVQVPA
jgi:hypothetical protein